MLPNVDSKQNLGDVIVAEWEMLIETGDFRFRAKSHPSCGASEAQTHKAEEAYFSDQGPNYLLYWIFYYC